MNSVLSGAITEMSCQLKLIEDGYMVSVPVYPARYDFLLDTGKHIYRVQIKKCRRKDDILIFSTASVRQQHHQYLYTDYANDVDFIGTFYNGETYLVPIAECKSRQKILRLAPPKNNQCTNIFYAEVYKASTILKVLEEAKS